MRKLILVYFKPFCLKDQTFLQIWSFQSIHAGEVDDVNSSHQKKTPAHILLRRHKDNAQMAAPWATYPRHSCLSCATLPWQVNPWGSQGCPGLRGAGFGGCRAGGCAKRRPQRCPGSPAPGRAEAAEAAREDLLPLGASFLFSQFEIPCPGVMGEGNPKLGVSLAPRQCEQRHKRTQPWWILKKSQRTFIVNAWIFYLKTGESTHQRELKLQYKDSNELI